MHSNLVSQMLIPKSTAPDSISKSHARNPHSSTWDAIEASSCPSYRFIQRLVPNTVLRSHCNLLLTSISESDLARRRNLQRGTNIPTRVTSKGAGRKRLYRCTGNACESARPERHRGGHEATKKRFRFVLRSVSSFGWWEFHPDPCLSMLSTNWRCSHDDSMVSSFFWSVLTGSPWNNVSRMFLE